MMDHKREGSACSVCGAEWAAGDWWHPKDRNLRVSADCDKARAVIFPGVKSFSELPLGPQITHQFFLEENNTSKGKGRLLVRVYIDGEHATEAVVLSGPMKDIKDYFKGQMTLKDVRKKWGME